MNLSEIDNTVYLLKSLSNAQIYPNSTWLNSYIILSSLFTGQIVKKIENILVEYIAQFFFIKSFCNDHMYPNSTQLDIMFVLFTGQIMKNNSVNHGERANTM